MDKITTQQLQILKNKYPFDESNGRITFHASTTDVKKEQKKIVFADYFVKPFDGFDFHDKFNNGTPPYAITMYGEILKETEKMYYVSVHSESSDKLWVGWVPKKSCTIS